MPSISDSTRSGNNSGNIGNNKAIDESHGDDRATAYFDEHRWIVDKNLAKQVINKLIKPNCVISLIKGKYFVSFLLCSNPHTSHFVAFREFRKLNFATVEVLPQCAATSAKLDCLIPENESILWFERDRWVPADLHVSGYESVPAAIACYIITR